ncbi:MAG: virulence RhuM family protein [Chlamydiota bacterium]
MGENFINQGQILLYQTEDGRQRIEVHLHEGSVWLSQKLLAELYGVGVSTINYHIREIYKENELRPEATIRKYRIVQTEGERQVLREIDFYDLKMVLAVGYRIRSHRGVQFRQWATERLQEYVVKGFVLDDERLSKPGGMDYFDELLDRIRTIRVSEKRFYQKIRDIYTLSADYDPQHPMTQEFFKTVQNKLLYAVTGCTAAEIIHGRANASIPNMGLTTWNGAGRGKKLRKQDVEIAKNYLNREEIRDLELLVSQYLDFAERQARGRKVLYMADWKTKLDAFLELNDDKILTHAGKISAEMANEFALSEYAKFEEHRKREELSHSEEELQEALSRVMANRGSS